MRSGDTPDRVGVGLAAPQIGENLRIIVLEYAGTEGKNGKIENAFPTTILINPEVVKFSKDKNIVDEGCFSVPIYYGPVERPKKIRVQGLDRNGKKININASGYFSRVLQHEIDHLDGILYIDRVEKGKLYRYVKTDDGNWEIEY
jgi:peptide deformylase